MPPRPPAAANDAGCAPETKKFVLAATILGSSLAFIDGTVVSIALPAIQSELAGGIADAQWVVASYTLMLGALVLVGGGAGDRFGRRRIFTLGIILFTLASIACGLAPGTGLLIAARALQGIGAAMLVPSSLAIVSAAFSKAERGRAIGTWAGFSALTTALGPILGGAFVDALSWRAVFFLNVPVALATLAITLRHVPESRDEGEEGPIDWLGGALAVAAFFCFTYGLTGAPTKGWGHPLILGALLAGLILLALFIRREAVAPAPMLPLDLFRAKNFAAANGFTLLLYFTLGGLLFFLPFALIRGAGYSATEAGAAFLPFTLVMGGLSRWTGGLVPRIGARLLLSLGPLIVAAGFGTFALLDITGSYWVAILPGMLLLGLGMALAVAPLTTVVMDSVPENRSGVASGTNNAVSRIAGMLAVALLGAIAVELFRVDLDRRVAPLNLTAEIHQALAAEVPKLAEAVAPAAIQGEARRAVESALTGAFLDSYRAVMLIAAALAIVCALCALVAIKG